MPAGASVADVIPIPVDGLSGIGCFNSGFDAFAPGSLELVDSPQPTTNTRAEPMSMEGIVFMTEIYGGWGRKSRNVRSRLCTRSRG